MFCRCSVDVERSDPFFKHQAQRNATMLRISFLRSSLRSSTSAKHLLNIR